MLEKGCAPYRYHLGILYFIMTLSKLIVFGGVIDKGTSGIDHEGLEKGLRG